LPVSIEVALSVLAGEVEGGELGVAVGCKGAGVWPDTVDVKRKQAVASRIEMSFFMER